MKIHQISNIGQILIHEIVKIPKFHRSHNKDKNHKFPNI